MNTFTHTHIQICMKVFSRNQQYTWFKNGTQLCLVLYLPHDSHLELYISYKLAAVLEIIHTYTYTYIHTQERQNEIILNYGVITNHTVHIFSTIHLHKNYV